MSTFSQLGGNYAGRGPSQYDPSQRGAYSGWIGAAPLNGYGSNGQAGMNNTYAASGGRNFGFVGGGALPSSLPNPVMGPTAQFGARRALPDPNSGTTFTPANPNYTAPPPVARDGRLGAMGQLLGSSDPAQQAQGRQQLNGLLGSTYGDYFRSIVPQQYTQPGIGW